MEKGFELNKVTQGLRFAIILSLFISAVLILFTMDGSSLNEALTGVSPVVIPFLFIMIILNWVFAGLRLKILLTTIGGRLTLLDSIVVYLAGAFISNVTPFATGGGPFQIYFLHKKGVNIGKASTVIVTQFILRIFFFGIASFIFLVFFNQAISPGVVPPYLFYLAFGLGFLFAVFLIIFSLVPAATERFLKLIFKINRLRSFFQNSYRAKKLLVKARKELRDFHASLDLLGKYKGRLLLAGLCTVFYWSTLFMIIPLTLKGLGLQPYYFRSYVMQTIFYLILPFMPTPGASGIAEIGFASIFVAFIPGSLIGLVTFIWRFISFYIILLIGGFFAFREIGWKRSMKDG